MTITIASSHNISPALAQLTKSFDAMYLAQLTAFAFEIPQLYFCREYLAHDEQDAIEQCLQRLQKGISDDTFTLQRLTQCIDEKYFFDTQEARLRLAPEPESWLDI